MAELVTPDELDAYLSGNSDRALTLAEAAVRAYCGWHVAPVKSETVTVWGDGDGMLLLPSLHVVSVESVAVGGEPVEDYTFREHGTLHTRVRHCRSTLLWGHRHAGGGWCGEVEVAFTHGHAADSVEAETVKGVILSAASRSRLNPSGVSRTQVGQISETYSQAGRDPAVGAVLNPQELRTLDRFKLPPRP